MHCHRNSGSKKGFGLLLAISLAVFGARSAAGSVVTALNIAYEEKERRSFIVVNLLALGITAVAVTLYRYGPSRADPRWVWLTPGSLFSAVMRVALTLGFGIYVAKFGNYNATYGSLGAVVVLLTWIYLSGYVLLFGAEINFAVEHQASGKAKSKTVAAAINRTSDDQVKLVGSTLRAQAMLPRRLRSLIENRKPPVKSSLIQSLAASYALARGSLRIARDIRQKRVGKISLECATLGLSLIRKLGCLPHGLSFIAAAVTLALVARDLNPQDTPQLQSARRTRLRWPLRIR